MLLDRCKLFQALLIQNVRASVRMSNAVRTTISLVQRTSICDPLESGTVVVVVAEAAAEATVLGVGVGVGWLYLGSTVLARHQEYINQSVHLRMVPVAGA